MISAAGALLKWLKFTIKLGMMAQELIDSSATCSCAENWPEVN
jgi:hypothetical protein